MMSNTEDESPTDRAAKNTPKEEYPVGYCRPPVAHRFKHGNKANPKGRKKGTRNRTIVIRDLLLEPVTIRIGDTTTQVTAIEAVIKKLLFKALGGDGKAAFTIIGIAQKEGILTPEQEQDVDHLSDTDLAIMEDVKRRLEAAQPPEPPTPGAQTPDPVCQTAQSPSGPS